MTFFNTKEEVIDIELTPYGKHLLSKGQWKPEYYEFYDDDVVYDAGYIGTFETQDATQKRIKETPRNKVQYSFEGAETRYKEYQKQFRDLKNLNISVLEKRKNFSLSCLPLANSSIDREKIPTWNISVLRGKIQSVDNTFNVTGLPNNANILELDTIYYKTSVVKGNPGDDFPEQLEDISQVGGVSDITFLHRRFEDGTYISIDDDYLLLDIKEDQVEILNENFDLFVYLLENDEKTGKEIEIPLAFEKRKERVVNNLYVESESEDSLELETAQGTDFVSHYFNLYLDREISSEVLCKHLSKEEIEKLRVRDGYNINCEEGVGKLITPRPVQSVLTQDDLNDFEDC